MKPRHRAIWSGLRRFGRNLADEGLAILRPSIRTALQTPRTNVQRMRNAVQTQSPACLRIGLAPHRSTLCDSITSIALQTCGESGSTDGRCLCLRVRSGS